MITRRCPRWEFLFFDLPNNSLIGSYERFSISRDQVVNWGQMYSMYNSMYNYLQLGLRFSIFRSLWYKNTVCRMYQVRTYHTPAILSYTTHTREPWLKLEDFDTTLSHSFLGQISYLRHRNPSWVSALATHQTCFTSVAWGCSFPWGLLKARVKVADLASESQRWYSGASPF